MTINIPLFCLTIYGSLLLTINTKVYAQENRKVQLEIVQGFHSGNIHKYEIERGNIDSKRPELKHIKTVTDTQLRVLSPHNDYRECSWKYGSTKFIGIDPSQVDENSKKNLNIYREFEVKFTVDTNGIIQEITNFEACKAFLEKASGQLLENVSTDQRAQTMGMLWASFETPEILRNTYCPELSLLFSLFGEVIEQDSIYASDSELPNPFGGRKFPSKQTTKLDYVKGDIVGISVKQDIPVSELNPIVRETFAGLAKLAGKPFVESDLPKIEINSSAIYRYDLKRKKLLDVSSEKLVEVNGAKQIQTLKVRLKE